MNINIGQSIEYNGKKGKVIGIIPAFFKVGSFPSGIDDIDIDIDIDLPKKEKDTVLIDMDSVILRVDLLDIKIIEKKSKPKKKRKEKGK